MNFSIIGRFFSFFLISTMLFSLSGCGRLDVTCPSEPNSNFSFQTFALLSEEYVNQNFVFSPSSLRDTIALAVLPNTDGDSSVSRVLGFARGWRNGNLQGLGSEKSKNFLHSFSIWADRSLIFEPTYKSEAEKFFGADVEMRDFASTGILATEINEWADRATFGLIKNMVSEESLKDANVALIGAVAIDCKWAQTFEVSYTQKMNFTLENGKKVKVDMMRNTSQLYRYADTQNFSAIMLPYKKEGVSDFAMIVAKSKFGDGALPTFAEFVEIRSQFEKCDGDASNRVFLPKFKISTEVGGLKAVLKKIGAGEIFENPLAFSNVFENAKLAKNVTIVQRAKIETCENGTKAAAVTEIKWLACGVPVKPPRIFVGDSPFVFYIIERDSGVIHFMGRVFNPCK